MNNYGRVSLPTTKAMANYTACRDCTRRSVGCHSVCEDYKAFKEAHAAESKAMKEAYMQDKECDAFRKAGVEKWKRKERNSR